MIWVYFTLGAVVWVLGERLLFKHLPLYRWIVESLNYPVNRYLIDRAYARMTRRERRDALQQYQTGDYECKKHWYGKRLEIHLLRKWGNLI